MNEGQSAALHRADGVEPQVFGEFVRFPYDAEVAAQLEVMVEQVRDADATLLLTLEPHDGLVAVTDEVLAELTDTLRRWNEAGTPVLVRFARNERRLVQLGPAAGRVRRHLPPRCAGGPGGAGQPDPVVAEPEWRLPVPSGWFEAQPGTEAFALLDTDADGARTQADDPYRPYYPGDEHVDWVGLSLYHFGDAYPWGENAEPEPGKFAAKLTGSYDGRGGDQSALPDFHAQYARRTGKPLAISETSALYNSGRVGQGAGNTTIKTAWLKQVFADDVPEQFEQLRLIMWFEQDKVEPDVPGGVTNWSLSRDAELREAFREALPDWLRQAP